MKNIKWIVKSFSLIFQSVKYILQLQILLYQQLLFLFFCKLCSRFRIVSSFSFQFNFAMKNYNLGWSHMTSTLGEGVVRQKWDFFAPRGVGDSECFEHPIFIFFVKENWVCAMTRHHAGSNIDILLTRNLPIDSVLYRGWLGPHGSCYNTNTRPSFLNSQQSF